jgi:2-oxoglutarate ferredoxin oxidoreductase subunit alpha
MRAEGIKAGLFRPITIWPFPEKRVAELGKQVNSMVVVEMNLGQMIFEVERIVKNDCKLAGVFRVDGDPINPGEIMAKVKEVL